MFACPTDWIEGEFSSILVNTLSDEFFVESLVWVTLPFVSKEGDEVRSTLNKMDPFVEGVLENLFLAGKSGAAVNASGNRRAASWRCARVDLNVRFYLPTLVPLSRRIVLRRSGVSCYSARGLMASITWGNNHSATIACPAGVRCIPSA